MQEFTDLQMDVLNLIWQRKGATINELVDLLKPNRSLSRSTVATVVARLEKHGILNHIETEDGFVYQAITPRESVVQHQVNRVIQNLFGGKKSALLSHLLQGQTQLSDMEQAQEILKSMEDRGD